MNDTVLLKICESRDNYFLVRKHIKKDLVSRETYSLLGALGDYYEKHSEVNSVDFDNFFVWFTNVHTIDIKLKEIELYKTLIEKVKESDSVIVSDLIEAYKDKDIKASILDSLIRNKSIDEIKSILDNANLDSKDSFDVSCNLHDQFEVIDRTKGLTWSIPWMNEDLAPLIMGDFGVLAGMVEAGKTSFVISQAVHMAEQLSKDKQVLWFVNEGFGRVTLDKMYQSFFKITNNELNNNLDHYMQKYEERMGRLDKIQVVDSYGFTHRDIEARLRKSNAGLIVIDMMDNVRGFHGNKNVTSDWALEQLYQWGRELACKVAPLLVTSQFAELSDNEKKYPSLEKLKGSRVAKQGACSFVLTLGMDERDSLTRYLGCVKNKLRDHNRRYFKRTISFDVTKVDFK